jgi:hypothetical protein
MQFRQPCTEMKRLQLVCGAIMIADNAFAFNIYEE